MGGNQSTSGSDKSSKKTEDSKTDSPINQTSSSNTKCATSINQASSSNTKCTTLNDSQARVPSHSRKLSQRDSLRNRSTSSSSQTSNSTSECLDFTYLHLSMIRLCDDKIPEISFMWWSGYLIRTHHQCQCSKLLNYRPVKCIYRAILAITWYNSYYSCYYKFGLDSLISITNGSHCWYFQLRK